ncbi:MAG TPA: hypothetical protein DCS07_09815 [Bdellovibrionales bacterium]|nr:MAG: hypothetical protein A2Z97_00370 [Bdellovibrionales bacterium GWB1_52_6]OFZ03224.1 MAG: hypothetical protein A2X97_09860 [Bdellovibrionales bacterium GWA1_52_35]OFZ38238.1 MAG: hypothetical protein A2070_05010 [Bdellovibrionales bacterium GWC1_52_8]HAR42908.1 hypothetical protein [Bdellovibrionales bacterium]HCM40595.1 hypothetical protein [Bdellovibrionales bacterium]
MTPNRLQVLAFFIIGALLLAPAARAEYVPEYASILPPLEKNKIPGLIWKQLKIPVLKQESGGNTHLYVKLQVELKEEDWTLSSVDPKQIKVTMPSKASDPIIIVAALKGAVTPLEILAIGPFGEAETKIVQISFSSYSKYMKAARPPTSHRPAKRYVLAPSIGLSFIQYSETHQLPFSETALTAKIGYAYQLSPLWDMGLNTYFTALPLSSSTSGVTARYIGINGKVGYQVTTPDPWKLSLQFGGYFTTMLVTQNRFGFANLMGPQIFPVLRRTLGADSVSGYFKFSPIGSGFSFMELSNREIAVGLGWTHRLAGGNVISFNADYATLDLLIENTAINSSSFSLSVGYAL